LGQRSLRLPKPHAACELALQDRVRSQIIYRLSIIVRKVWGAKAATRPYVSDWNYTGIAVHHAGNSHSCAADARGQMQDIQQTETGKGFVDVGYHYGISCAGAIYEGRDIRYKGEHVLNQNTGLIGIVLLADFTKRGEGAKFGKNETMIGRLRDRMDFSNEDTLAAQQLSALGSLITTLQDFFDLTRLGGHREFGAALGDERSCPGDLVIAQLDGLRKQHGLIAP
jgi:hypothetical protein